MHNKFSSPRGSKPASGSSRKPGGYRGSRPNFSSGGFSKSGPAKGGFSRGHSGGAGGSRGGSSHFRGGFRGNFAKRGPVGEYLNPSRFVNKVVVSQEVEVYKPEHAFADFAIDERLKKAIVTKGYTQPAPIQDRTIPLILKGADMVGIANTGTGKTASFLIPLINKVLAKSSEKVLIIVPTRELAIQIEQELKSFTIGMQIYSVCCVGGMSLGKQLSGLRFKYNFIIGTPGRLKDLIDRKNLRPTEFNTIVLDEADRMLDMGFVNDMRMIMTMMPKERQTLLFSATVDSSIDNLIKEFLREPVRISVKTGDTSKNVEQDVVRTAGKDKLEILHELLLQKDFSKVLVFGRTKHGVEKLSKMLIEKGFKAESIHGNKNHSKRQQALRLFKEGNIQVLVATDVAARGLDIADVSHVINYELPATYDDYVHRIGRTGRGNKRGKALTFIH
jgi:superfamily II DNA/RNA helicase